MALTSAQRVELIQKMYVAYYGRPADTGGLDNWINHLVQHNDDASAIIQAFGTSPEATSLYGEPVNYALAVNALYMQMFNRPAEPDGLALYVAHLNAGRVTLPNLALTIATGAQNADRDTFLNKVEVATAFTAEVATSTENILGYAGEDAAAHAAAFLASVDATDASVTAALADLESTIEMINGLDQLSSLPTHYLTSALDNLLGTNGNDVVLAELDGNQDLELDDAFNALLGQDTLRLDIVDANSNVEFIATDYEMVGFERVLVQARADDADLYLDLDGMVGVDLEVRNMIGYDADLEAENVDGDVLVVNFDGYDLDLNNVSGDVAIRDLQINSGYGDVNIFNVDGDLLIEDFYIDESVEIGDVVGDVVLTGSVDSDGNTSVITGDFDIDVVGGNVTLTNINFDTNNNFEDINISEVSGTTVTFSNIDTDGNIELEFSNTVTAATINFDGLQAYEGEYMDIDGASVTSYTFNVTEDSNLNEIHLDHNNDALSAITLNLGAELIVDEFQVASSDIDGNDIASTLTITGGGDLIINSITDDDNLSVIYTGSGSIQIGSEDGNSSWEPETGSFNASSATGDVSVYLDLNDSDLDFTYAGSKGSDRVDIEQEGSLDDAATGADVVAISLNGGAGTDTLVVSTDVDLTQEAMAVVSNFEVLELDLAEGNSDQTFDLDFADEFETLVLADGNGNDITLINLSADLAQNITILASDENCNTIDNLTIALEDNTGSDDAVEITYIHDIDKNDNNIANTLTLDDIEHLTINMTGDAQSLDDNGNVLATPDLTFGDINANDLETITITGAVSLNLVDLNTSDDLRNIDATTFTGATLMLGDTEGEGVVWTDDDLVIAGSLTADHQIDVNGNEDVTITTGSGDDYMVIDALDDIVITAGNGDNDIFAWSLAGDITVTTGIDDDAVYAAGGDGDQIAVNLSATLGDGNDDFNYEYDGFEGDLEVDAGAGGDNVDIYLDSDENLDSATVTLGAGDDSLYLWDTARGMANDFVVTVTDFAVADDVLFVDHNAAYGTNAEYLTVDNQDGDYDLTDGVASDDYAIVEFTFDADNNSVELDINSDGADLLLALGDSGAAEILTDGGQEGYFAVYNSGNAYIFNFDNDHADDTEASAVVTSNDDGGTTEGDAEDVTITITVGDEGFTAGDVITITNAAADGADAGVGFDSISYTIQETGQTLASVLQELTSLINDAAGDLYDATLDLAGYIYLESNGEIDLDDVTVSYINNYDLVTSDEIELIAVLEGVAVNGFTAANIGFGDIA